MTEYRIPYPFKPIEEAPRDGSTILAAERPPFERKTFFYNVFWCDDRRDYVSGVERALNGATHYIPADRLAQLPPAEDEPGFYDKEDESTIGGCDDAGRKETDSCRNGFGQ